MDPFTCILPELYDMVTQHFTVADFQETTQVTPIWNEKLGESWKMMKAVKLKFNHQPSIDLFSNIAKGMTTRRYQNVYIDSYILDSRFSDTILGWVSSETISSIETRFIREVCEKRRKIFDGIDMSRLRCLKLRDPSEDFVWSLISQCSSLTELHLIGSSFQPSIVPISTLRSFLDRNQTLKVLKLFPSFYETFFENDISEIAQFQLKGLQTRNTEGFEPKFERIERNFEKFLVKQSQTLERLEIYTCKPTVMEHIFNNMPALKDFRIQKVFETRGLRLNVNETLDALFIPRIEESHDFRNILQKVPNITQLFTLRLTREKLDIINEILPGLRILMCCIRRHRLEDPIWNRVIRMTNLCYPCYGQMWKIEM